MHGSDRVYDISAKTCDVMQFLLFSKFIKKDCNRFAHYSDGNQERLFIEIMCTSNLRL